MKMARHPLSPLPLYPLQKPLPQRDARASPGGGKGGGSPRAAAAPRHQRRMSPPEPPPPIPPAHAGRASPAVDRLMLYITWLVPVLEQFPRSQRFLLGDRLQGLRCAWLRLTI